MKPRSQTSESHSKEPLDPINCPRCKTEVQPHLRLCHVCQTDIGFPNVRAADTLIEKSKLQQRVADAEVSTKARGCLHILEDFGNAVSKSKAIINRSLSITLRIISDENFLYQSFYKEVESGSRLPEKNTYDTGRSSIDSLLFPHYKEEIRFAALSLGPGGSAQFGPCSIILNEEAIRHRASLFEENPFQFCHKHGVIAGTAIPPGYRTTWDARKTLAMAKLHSKIDANTLPEHYPKILLTQTQDDKNSDFIEVHIYGPIHLQAIERIIGRIPKNRKDKVLWKSIKESISKTAIILEAQ